jgi:hypothetical protein
MLARITIASIALTLSPISAATPPETIITGPRNTDALAIADAFDRAQLTQDRARLEAMVDDDLIFIQGSGVRAGKRAFIDGWTTPGDQFDPVKLIDRTVLWLGPDTFMVTASTTLRGMSGGKRFASSFYFTDTFRRTAGTWRAIHIQVTRIAG